MTQQHSPGPRRIVGGNTVCAADRSFVGEVTEWSAPKVRNPRMAADTALFASAPDLLSEARDTATFLEGLAPLCEAAGMPGQAGNCTIRARALRAVIAKAAP